MALQTDLDPLFLKALALLHSTEPDARAKLKALLEEERSKRRGDVKPEKVAEKKEPVIDQKEPVTLTGTVVASSAVTSDSKVVLVGSSSSLDLKSISSIDAVTNAQALEIVETVEELSSSSFTEPDDKTETEIGSGSVVIPSDLDFDEVMQELDSSVYLEPVSKKPKTDDEQDWTATDEVLPDDKEALELEFGGSLDVSQCVTCKMEGTDPDNVFVECHECHSPFHQKCHKPPISSKDLNDPRYIFYCIPCTKQMRKEMAAQQQQQQQQSSFSKVKQQQQQPSASRPLSNPFQLARSSIQPFRRPSTSSSPAPNQAGNTVQSSTEASNVLNVLSPSPRSQSPTSSSQRSSPSFRTVLPQDAALKSMKRLESLKKKAKIQQQMRAKK